MPINPTLHRWAQHRAAALGAAALAALLILAAITYIQPRHHSTTQLARFLNDDAKIATQFKAKGLQPSEAIVLQTAQDTRYRAAASDAWGRYELIGSVTVMPSSGGAQIIWTLEHDTGYQPVQRWLAAARITEQGAALQARLQAFKLGLEQAAAPPAAATAPTATKP